MSRFHRKLNRREALEALGVAGAALVSGCSTSPAAANSAEYAQPGYNGTGQTFLRGLQTTNAQGQATFRTIYPGWYQGRATHIHVQVFVGGRAIKTTQIAFPEDVTSSVYRTGVYASKGQSTAS